jgi:regulator of replication initiation timing
MENGLIDDGGFELGMPSREEMLKHQCTLLCAELETTRQDLRKAHQNIAKLIIMHRESVTELSALKVEHERLRWTVSEMYSQERAQGKASFGYAYGDHTKGKA